MASSCLSGKPTQLIINSATKTGIYVQFDDMRRENIPMINYLCRCSDYWNTSHNINCNLISFSGAGCTDSY